MTEPILTLLLLAILAIIFVLNQHGYGNTLLSIGLFFYDAGTRFNARSARRRKLLVQRWAERLEAAE